MYFRYLLCAPFTLIALGAFALYFGVRNAGYFRKGLPMILWGATAGVLTAATNPLYNVFIASFVFLRPPVWFNESGQFSPFLTTRLKAYRKEGPSFLVDHLVTVINSYDPGHF